MAPKPVVEYVLETEVFLADETLMATRISQHEVDHGSNARRGGHLDRRPESSGNDLRIDLADIVFFAQLAVLPAGHGDVDHHHVLQGLRHGVLQDALHRGAIMVELQVVHEKAHLGAMTRVTHGLVVHALHARTVGVRERAEATRGVEGLVRRTVDLDFLQALERGDLDGPPIDDGLAGVAVLVDQALGGPGERILEDVVRMLGQRAHTQLDAAQLVEMSDQRVGGDADEAGRQPALRHECALGALGERTHGARHGDILGEVEVVRVRLAGRLGDRHVAVERQAGYDCVHRMRAQVGAQLGHILSVQAVGVQSRQLVRIDYGAGDFGIDVRDVHLVIAGFGQQAGNQGADLAGSQDEDFVHQGDSVFPVRPAIAGNGPDRAGSGPTRGGILTKRAGLVTSAFFCSANIRARIAR